MFLNMEKWYSREAVVSEPGYAAYATVWFNDMEEAVAIEPHTAGDYETGEKHYYNRIMGDEILEFKIDLYEVL